MITSAEPVAVMKTSPIGAASAIGSTRKPRSTASSARTGSTSVITTRAPSARADSAMPAPQAPNPATTTVLPASRTPLARSSPSMTDCAVPWVLSTIRVTGVSLAAITGKASVPSAAIRRSRSTPVVVPSHPPRTRSSTSRGALGVQRGHQVAAVVEHQVRPVASQRRRRAPSPPAQGERDVLVVRVPVHPGPGEHLDPVAGRERGGDVVLGGQRVGRRQPDQRAARPQRPDEHRRSPPSRAGRRRRSARRTAGPR